MMVWKLDLKKPMVKNVCIQLVHQVTWLYHLKTGHPYFGIQMVTVPLNPVPIIYKICAQISGLI